MYLNHRLWWVAMAVQGLLFLPAYASPTASTADKPPITKRSAATDGGEISRDLANIARIKKQIADAMKAQNPNAVVSDMARLAAARQKLERDDQIEKAEANVALIRRDIKDDMKAGQAQAVVTDMQRLQTAKWQLKMLRQAGEPFGPAVVQPYRFTPPTGTMIPPPTGFGPPSSGTVSASEGGFTVVARPLPHRQFSHLTKLAAKPVGYDSVLQLGFQLRRHAQDPQKLVGMLVTADLKLGADGTELVVGSRGIAGRAARRTRIRLLSVERQIAMHYRAIRVEAREREAAEHRYQLMLQEQRYPNAAEWEVPPNIANAEALEAGKIIRAADRSLRRAHRRLAIATKPPVDCAMLVSADGQPIKKSGIVYGVVVGVWSRKVEKETPQFTLPSGPTFRAQHILGWIGHNTSPTGVGIFLGQVPGVTIPSATLPAATQYRVEILYCGRAPHYRQAGKKRVLLPITGYLFHLKHGKVFRADTYTTGRTVYECKWDGMTIPILKSSVTRITAIRKSSTAGGTTAPHAPRPSERPQVLKSSGTGNPGAVKAFGSNGGPGAESCARVLSWGTEQVPVKYQIDPIYVSGTYQVWVSASGRVRKVKIIKSCGHPSMDQAFIDVLVHTRFSPAISNGVPVSSHIPITLSNGSPD